MNRAVCTSVFIGLLTAAGLSLPLHVSAHVPVVGGPADTEGQEAIVRLEDPTVRSLAVYGWLDEAGDADRYVFAVTHDAEIPVEALVPVRPTLRDFRPIVSVERMGASDLDDGMVVITGSDGERQTFYEEYGQELYWKNGETRLAVTAGESYLVTVAAGSSGEYVLGIGTVENFTDVDLGGVLADVARVKLGLYPGRQIPWPDLAAVFLMLAGFVIGLGAVTVIDLHGFLGRRSPYWTEATIRTHKVTKPLIWAGTGLAAAGGAMLYRHTGLSGTALFHLVLLVVLVANGCFLTFVVSPFLLRRERERKAREPLPPSLQRKIAASFAVSFLGWWSSAALFVWYLLILR